MVGKKGFFELKKCTVSGLKRQFDKWHLFRAPTGRGGGSGGFSELQVSELQISELQISEFQISELQVLELQSSEFLVSEVLRSGASTSQLTSLIAQEAVDLADTTKTVVSEFLSSGVLAFLVSELCVPDFPSS